MGFFSDIGGFLGGLGKKMGGTLGDIASVAVPGYGLTRLSLLEGGRELKGIGGLLGEAGDVGAIPPLLMPPLPPDATDEQIRQAVLMQRRRLLLGQGQGSTFISGPLGDASSFATSKSSAGGF